MRSSTSHPRRKTSAKIKLHPDEYSYGPSTQNSHFSKQDWHSDDFGMRSPVIHKTLFLAKMCYLHRTRRLLFIKLPRKNIEFEHGCDPLSALVLPSQRQWGCRCYVCRAERHVFFSLSLSLSLSLEPEYFRKRLPLFGIGNLPDLEKI